MKYKAITGLEKDELISMTGIRGYSKYYDSFPCFIGPPAISIQIRHNHRGIELKRTIHSYEKKINNEICRIYPKGTGDGLRVLRSQLDYASKAGFEFVYCEAYGEPKYINKWNGFVTWGKLGYRMFPNSQLRFEKLMQQFNPEIKEISDLLLTDEGLNFWKEHGFSWLGKFELQKESKSWEILNNYLKRKGLL